MPPIISSKTAPAERSLRPALLLAIPLLAGAAYCAHQLQTEWRAATALAASRTSSGLVPSMGADAGPRELVYTAEAIAAQAVRLAPGTPQRTALLEDASARMARGLALRPRWGEAWVIQTHLLAITQGVGSQEGLRAFQTSYALDPFLRDAADWRLQYAVATWPALPPQTREAVTREAIMLSRVSRDLRAHVRVMTYGTPIYPLIEHRIWPSEAVRQ